MKTCLKDGCSNFVFSHGFCKSHQWCRTDPKKPKPLQNTHKKTGELDLFLAIWNERPHICEECDEPIRCFSVSLFHHKKPKSRYPELRLDKENVALICVSCHFKIHNG